jgi:hypothetical protein
MELRDDLRDWTRRHGLSADRRESLSDGLQVDALLAFAWGVQALEVAAGGGDGLVELRLGGQNRLVM